MMMDVAAIDPVELARALIRCESVTPAEGGALDLLQKVLGGLGFRCQRLRFSSGGGPEIDNLYARYGQETPNFCFAGHSDVVPVGDRATWRLDPFAATIADGQLYGRGASDMKGAIASFIAAAADTIRERGAGLQGSISLLITGDEEGPATDGTVKVLRHLAETGERLDLCLVGEPTNPTRLGEMVKIGRRGSLTGRLRVHGAAGHVGYPDLADNPLPRLINTLQALLARRLDDGNGHFQPSNLEITTIDTGNPATNVIPGAARAVFNIRYNTEHQGADLEAWIRNLCTETAGDHELAIEHGAAPFLTPPGPLTELIRAAILSVTGRAPELSTTGGTSDARFIRAYCPVAEFGLISQTMHKADERVALADLAELRAIYAAILARALGPS